MKYIQYELAKCMMGESKVMSDYLICSGKTSSRVMYIATITLPELKNPFADHNLNSSYWYGVRLNARNTGDEDVGFINLTATSDTEIAVRSCNKTPCSNADNRQESFILIE